jgi:chromosome segregation ATPase
MLSEVAIADNLAECDSSQLALKADIKKISEFNELIKQTTNTFKTELDFQSTSVNEEANAKIKAQEEHINPIVSRLNKEYKRKINRIVKTFYKRIKKLQTKRRRVEKSVEKSEEKIDDYRRETAWQESRGRYYEKRWRKKFARLRRELASLTKKLERIESSIDEATSQKNKEVSDLSEELNAIIQFTIQPLMKIKTYRQNKIDDLEQRNQQLTNLENGLIEGLSKFCGDWDNEKVFERLSLKGLSVKQPTLFMFHFII